MKKYLTVVTERGNYRTRQVLFIDATKSQGVSDLSECPEDAIIGRDLIDCHDISRWIEKGAVWANAGYELIFNSVETDNLEEFDIEEYLKKVEVQA